VIFVDTGAFLARHLPSDQHHRAAVASWSDLASSRERLLTTNLVVAEFLTLLARRASPAFAAQRGRHLYASTAVEVLRASESDETLALALLESRGPAGVGFVDCVSFVMMRKHSISSAFTFDGHFADSGFRTFPS
jgi:uncharacterized protein